MNDNKTMKEQLLQLIKHYSEGKLSLKEQLSLAEQLANEKDLNSEEVLLEDWQDQLNSDKQQKYNLKPVLDRIHHQIRLSENKRAIRPDFIRQFQRIAAILIFPLILSFIAYSWVHYQQAQSNISFAEIECPMGARIKFQLPDGSSGYLNSGSKLKYPVRFGKERRVELDGEAYFEVAHNKRKPFHVGTKNLDIKVLGTTFDVISMEDESTEEIILQSGEVKVSTTGGKELAVLLPNEQLRLNKATMTFTRHKVEASQYTSWKEGKLVFRNENMVQLARRLSRWYNAEVLVSDSLLDNYTFHATFVNEPLEEVLKLLSLTTPLTYVEEKRSSNENGVFQKRKISIKIDQAKINHFR